jgi:hypothetical protein
LKDKTDCGKQVSPLSVRACHFYVGQDLSADEFNRESGTLVNDYNCFLHNGACFEAHSPYWQMAQAVDCKRPPGALNEKLMDICVDSHIAEIFTRYEAFEARLKSAVPPKTGAQQKMFDEVTTDSVNRIIAIMQNKNLSHEEIIAALAAKRPGDITDFLKAILIPKSCAQHAVTASSLGLTKASYIKF